MTSDLSPFRRRLAGLARLCADVPAALRASADRLGGLRLGGLQLAK